MEKKRNSYLLTIPVSSWEEAQLLGSETNWTILETLRDAGIEGLTVEEIAKKTKTPKSTVYNVLSKLQAANLVGSRKERKKWGRQPTEVNQRFHGKSRRVYFEEVEWGFFEFEEDFFFTLEPILEKHKDKIKKVWFDVLEEIVQKYKTDEELNRFFPTDRICENCEYSHEGIEFLTAISLAMITKFITERDEDFERFAKKYDITSRQTSG